jgi:hypothetical protein
MAGPATAAGDPPGNNGTVKIDGAAFDDHPDNEPHVGCEFQVDLYGFDSSEETGEDLEATVTFEAVPPTEGEEPLVEDTVAIGEDAAGGGTDLDASETYDLTDALAGIEPHAQQGWHVKLTVHADGSQGADTKHKVFWVEGCGPTTTSSSSTTSTSTPGSSSSSVPGSSSTVPGSSTSTVPGTHPSAPTSSGPGGSTPSTGVSPDAPTTVPAGAEGDLPRTGSSTVPLLVGAAALVALGLGGVTAARHLRAARG